MELVIEVVKKDGKAFKANGKWYNTDKRANLDFSDLKPGDVINAEVNQDVWVKSFELASHGSSTPSARKESTAVIANATAKDGMIARATAVKAVLESQTLAKAVDGMGTDQAIAYLADHMKAFEQYIMTGKFESVTVSA